MDEQLEIDSTDTSEVVAADTTAEQPTAPESNALKTISCDEDDLRVGNYIVLFGGRDLEGVGSPRVNRDGSKGEYFTPDTRLDSPYTKAGFLYVDWEHAKGELGPEVLGVARAFDELGFKIKATAGTHSFLAEHGIVSEIIQKMHEGRPNIVDGIKNGEIDLIINTPSGRLGKHDDSYIRKAAIKYRVPYITTTDAAVAAARGIAARREGTGEARSLQSYHAQLT